MNRSDVLSRAYNATTGRVDLYGEPRATLGKTAELWTVLLGVQVEPYQVALCLDAMKTARILANPTHEDSWVDKAGYAALGAELSKPDRRDTDHGGLKP